MRDYYLRFLFPLSSYHLKKRRHEEGNLEDGIADSGEHHLVDYHRHEHHQLHGLRTVLMDEG